MNIKKILIRSVKNIDLKIKIHILKLLKYLLKKTTVKYINIQINIELKNQEIYPLGESIVIDIESKDEIINYIEYILTIFRKSEISQSTKIKSIQIHYIETTEEEYNTIILLYINKTNTNTIFLLIINYFWR